MVETQIKAEPIGALIPSGHCSFPQTDHPEKTHERCAANGGGSRANPKKVFTPCPCSCHYGEEYECGGCGRPIVECLAWPFDVDGDLHYTHIDARGWATGEECGTTKRVSRNDAVEEAEPEVALVALEQTADALHPCKGCGVELDSDDINTLCEDCAAEEVLPPRLGLTPEEQFERAVSPPDGDDEFEAMLAEFDLD